MRSRSRDLSAFPITNSMVVTWIVAVALIIFAQSATRDMKRVPGGAQNFLEWLVESCTAFWKESSVRIWSSGRSGSLRHLYFYPLRQLGSA